MPRIRKQRLKVAMVAPPFGIIGGPELVVQHLTDELLSRGVDVTLFAPADWKTPARHIPTIKQSLWSMRALPLMTEQEKQNLIVASLIKVLNYQDQFNLIHLHSMRHAYPVAANAHIPCVLTMHSLISLRNFSQLRSAGIYTVALSQIHRKGLKTFAVIGNGIPVQRMTFSLEPGKYFIFIGRLNEQKGPDRAIQLARRAGVKLLIFGRIGTEPARQKFFRLKIKPYLDGKQIIYRGEVPYAEVLRAMCQATALLLPIRFPETFGLVAAEALACGTPVIATKTPPLTENLTDTRTAFLSNNTASLVKALRTADQLFDRHTCRNFAEEHFSISVMASRYLEVYQKALAHWKKRHQIKHC